MNDFRRARPSLDWLEAESSSEEVPVIAGQRGQEKSPLVKAGNERDVVPAGSSRSSSWIQASIALTNKNLPGLWRVVLTFIPWPRSRS
jgi:hypothetical protein